MSITRRTLLGAGSIGLVAALTSCSNRPGGNAGAAGVVEFWGNLPDQRQLDYFVEHFVEGYPGDATINYSQKSNLDRLIQTSLAAGQGPSVVVTAGPSTAVPEYFRAGYLSPLDDYSSSFDWPSSFAGWALDASKIDGKLASVPTAYESMVLYVNPGTLQQLGLSAPVTREEFEGFCEEAAGQGLVPIAAGSADWKGVNEWFVGLALNHGAGPEAVYSALAGETPWTDPVFVDAVERMAGYFTKGWIDGGVESYFTTAFPTVYGQLAGGQAAGMLSGTWDFANLAPYFGEEAGNDATWDFAPIPALGDGVPSEIWDLAIGQSLAINARAGDVDATAAYLDWLTTDVPTTVAAIEAVDYQPAPIMLDTADFSASADERTVRLFTTLSNATSVGYTTWTFFPQKTESYLIDYFEQVLTGSLTAADYCAGIQQQFAADLESGSVPVAPPPGAALS